MKPRNTSACPSDSQRDIRQCHVRNATPDIAPTPPSLILLGLLLVLRVMIGHRLDVSRGRTLGRTDAILGAGLVQTVVSNDDLRAGE
jgi:hypothetical protein